MFLNQTIPPPFTKGWSVIFFGGDVNLGRRTNYNLSEKPFGDLQIMSEADLRIINLECVVAAQGSQGIEKGEEKGIQSLVETYQEFGLSVADAVEKLITKLGLTEKVSSAKVNKYWK